MKGFDFKVGKETKNLFKNLCVTGGDKETMEIISNYLTQTVFSVGIIVLFGALIAFCRRAFCNIAGEKGPKILLATGIVGTPVHELSHALMCIVFGHKIREIKLYQPNNSEGTLGYVNHSYNPRNIYQQIGNFFIGIAPILGGSAAILALMYVCTPDLFETIAAELRLISSLSMDFFDGGTYKTFFELLWGIICTIFDFTNAGNVLWWVFIVLAFMIASHMELSGADIRGGLKGLAIVMLGLLIADIIMYFVSVSALRTVTSAVVSFSATIIGFLVLSAVFAGLMVIVALAVKGILSIKK